MTYTLYGGEILLRDPPRVPRCEALQHFSAKPSGVAAMFVTSPRSLPALDPAIARTPRRVGTLPVSGRPWSPGSVDAKGQWTPVSAEEVSPRVRAVPTSRAEAAALHDELLERLSAEPRLSYADQMRLVDIGMAEAARQARSTCSERGASLELLRAEYARLLAVLQGPARRGGLAESLRRELRREQARVTELSQELEAAQVREEAMRGLWVKRRAAAQLVSSGGRLSSAAQASGDTAGLAEGGGAEQLAVGAQIRELAPDRQLAVVLQAAQELGPRHRAAAAASLLRGLREEEGLVGELVGSPLLDCLLRKSK